MSLYRLLVDIYLDRRFSGPAGYSSFRGVYTDLTAASRSAPRTKPLGYDHDHLAQAYARELESTAEIRAYDYPVLFWLKDLLSTTRHLFDFGGNVGIHYYLYRRYLSYPRNLCWTVCDLEAIVRAGKDLAARRECPGLAFTLDFQKASGSDVFLASGSIQYLEAFDRRLAALSQLPRHLLLNRLPLYEGPSFATLQNGGAVFYPQYVFNRSQFIGTIQALGYRLVDRWLDPLDTCRIPFRADRSLRHYDGLYFQLEHP